MCYFRCTETSYKRISHICNKQHLVAVDVIFLRLCLFKNDKNLHDVFKIAVRDNFELDHCCKTVLLSPVLLRQILLLPYRLVGCYFNITLLFQVQKMLTGLEESPAWSGLKEVIHLGQVWECFERCTIQELGTSRLHIPATHLGECTTEILSARNNVTWIVCVCQ